MAPTPDDLDESPAPWCCPWYHGNTVITVKGSTPQEWGADWWSQCRDEIEEELANETSEESGIEPERLPRLFAGPMQSRAGDLDQGKRLDVFRRIFRHFLDKI